MKDRVAGAPGQYKASVTAEELLKMQAGKEFTIQMQRDDQPIEEGTPYSKAAVLPDELAQQLCPGIEDPTPADALKALTERGKGKAGFIYPLATEVVPDGFLLCDGAEYSREEYPELFAAIGTMYGDGDGELTFNVPDLAYTVVNYIIATGKGTAVSVSDIVLGAQAIPLSTQYGGTGANNGKDACKNISALHAIESTEHPGCYYRMVDGEKEWINPPMVFNEEYRTTEKMNGNPVYVKSLGVNITEADVLVCAMPTTVVRLHSWTNFSTTIPNNHPQEEWRINFYAANDGLRVVSGSSIVANPNASAWFQIWYTK